MKIKTFLKTKILILCVALLLGSFIAQGQSSSNDEVFLIKTITNGVWDAFGNPYDLDLICPKEMVTLTIKNKKSICITFHNSINDLSKNEIYDIVDEFSNDLDYIEYGVSKRNGCEPGLMRVYLCGNIFTFKFLSSRTSNYIIYSGIALK